MTMVALVAGVAVAATVATTAGGARDERPVAARVPVPADADAASRRASLAALPAGAVVADDGAAVVVQRLSAPAPAGSSARLSETFRIAVSVPTVRIGAQPIMVHVGDAIVGVGHPDPTLSRLHVEVEGAGWLRDGDAVGWSYGRDGQVNVSGRIRLLDDER